MTELYVINTKELERRAFAHAFLVHIDNCEACGGPDDGCEFGQIVESLLIRDLDFDPYPMINEMRREADKRGGSDG